MQRIDFYYGLGSRYSYLAFTQIGRIERDCRCRFTLNPISSIELMQLRGRSPFAVEPPSGQYDWAYRRRDAEAWADYYGVPFIEPLPQDHRLMARACWAADLQDALRTYTAALFRAVFAEHREIDAAVCTGLAQGQGLDAERFAGDMAGPVVEQKLSTIAREALARGAFGVPTFFVADRMFWGNDRLVLLEHVVRNARGC